MMDSLKDYLYLTLKIMIETHLSDSVKKLPFYLSDSHEFYETYIFGKLCLLMVDKTIYDFPAVIVARNVKKTEELLECFTVIYIQKKITAYSRKRLIELNTPFIIPGNQMWLPIFGDYLMENFKKIHARKNK